MSTPAPEAAVGQRPLFRRYQEYSRHPRADLRPA